MKIRVTASPLCLASRSLRSFPLALATVLLLGGDGRVEDGIRILKLNLEHFPESGFSYFTLGEGYRMTGQREEAITAYRKAQELIPGNPMIGRRLEEMEAEGG